MSMFDKDLQKNQTPAELAALRKDLINRFNRIQQEIEDYNEILHTVVAYGPTVALQEGGYSRVNEEWLLPELDRSIWKYFFGASKLSELMSQKQTKEFQEKLKDPEPFTTQAALVYKANIGGIAREQVQTLIKQVFENLTNNWYWTGNQRKKRSNTKIDVSCHVCEGIRWDGFFKSFRINDSYPPIFNDVEKACFVLDGKLPPKYPDDIHSHINELKSGLVGNEYFTVLCYKNGNQKVKFLRLDILEKLNQYGAPGGVLGQDIKIQEYK